MRNTDNKKLGKMFINRWSPRAFLADPVAEELLMTLFEAARWSPSCYNDQPWRFVFARSSGDLKRFRSVLVEANQAWACAAPVLVIAFSRKKFSMNDQPNRWADFDTGAAWMSLTLQAEQLGLHCHAMGGFDAERACAVTGVDPQLFNALCVIAIGKQGPAELLPDEIRAIETPNDRRPLKDMVTEGRI